MFMAFSLRLAFEGRAGKNSYLLSAKESILQGEIG
jgi:hypothetical protein